MTRRGIILAGGAGTRLYPATLAASKQLLPVYDKPMVYYPLSTLMFSGVRDILVISATDQLAQFKSLLGDGSRFGLTISYEPQATPGGIAEAYLIGEKFVRGEPSALVLGDNIFYGAALPKYLHDAGTAKSGATIFAYPVDEPQHFGVVELDKTGRPVGIVEKPSRPRSKLAVTGLYFYDGEAPSIARSLERSPRGELEITDLNRVYLERGALSVVRFGRGYVWLDAGTHEGLLEASNFVHMVERRQGLKIGCPEEIAWRNGWITDSELEKSASALQKSGYGDYLRAIMSEERG